MDELLTYGGIPVAMILIVAGAGAVLNNDPGPQARFADDDSLISAPVFPPPVLPAMVMMGLLGVVHALRSRRND